MIMKNTNKPTICYNCIWRESLDDTHHSRCGNLNCQVKGSKHGIQKGWFFWPFNFDPIWVEECDGFEDKNNEKD